MNRAVNTRALSRCSLAFVIWYSSCIDALFVISFSGQSGKDPAVVLLSVVRSLSCPDPERQLIALQVATPTESGGDATGRRPAHHAISSMCIARWRQLIASSPTQVLVALLPKQSSCRLRQAMSKTGALGRAPSNFVPTLRSQ